MKRPLLIAILVIFAARECAAQDSTESRPNSLEFSMRYEHYPQGADRTYTHLQYGRKIGSADIFAKALRYTVNTHQSWLFESESYIKFKDGGYSYFDAAWSASDFLPHYRLRAEVYQNWKRFEYSLGLGVVKPHGYQGIPLVTATLGYYFSDYFIYARPTFSSVDDGLSKSIFVQGRRYLTKTDFVAVSFLRGADTGTERTFDAIANSFGLDTYLLRVNGQMKSGRYKLGVGFDYGGLYIASREGYMKFAGVDVFINRSF